jgi:hypothetical protein
MKAIKYVGLVMMPLILSFVSSTELKYADKSVNIEVKGTSNLHDWSIKSDKGLVDATLIMGTGDKTVSISKLNFSVGSKTFKSGHSGMDKNVFKALQADAHPNIVFNLLSVAPFSTDGNTYTVKANGNLAIAGVTKQIELMVNCKWNVADKSLVVNGAKAFKMTEYSVKPPTALFGTIKTGDLITIAFYVKITK